MQDRESDPDRDPDRERESESDSAPPVSAGAQPASRRARRGAMWWLGWGLGASTLVVILGIGGLWLRLGAGPLILPEPLRAQIETRLDARMEAGRVAVGDMALTLPDGGRGPVIEFLDVTIADPGGAPRAAFPALRVHLDPRPILSGVLRPRRVEIAGAGLRLSRDAGGRFDLDLTGAAGAAQVTLPQTMARLDEMFASPGFEGLDEVIATGVQMSMTDAMTDQVMRIDDATARLTRNDSQLTLTIGGALAGSRDARLDLAVVRRAGEAETELAGVFGNLAARDLATVSPAFAWLDLMRAPISGRLALQLGDDGSVGALEGRLEIGAGTVEIGDADAPLRFDRIGADLRFDPADRRLSFTALALEAPALRFTARGHADVGRDGRVFIGQLGLSDIAGDPGGLFGREVAVDGAQVDLRLTLRPDLRLEIAQATVFHDAARLHLSGRVAAEAEGLDIALDARIPRMDVATILGFWPETARPGMRRWVAERLPEATAEGVDLAIRRPPGQDARIALDLGLRDMTLRAFRQGPPITGGAGALSLVDDRLVFRLEAGRIAAPGAGAIDLGGSTMVIADTTQEGPEADFVLTGRGRLAGLLSVLDGPPFTIFRNGEIGPERIGDGDLSFRTRVSTRLIRRGRPATLAELDLRAEADVTGFRATDLIAGREIAADRLALSLDPTGIAVRGTAEVSGVPVTGRWTQVLGPEGTGASVFEGRADLSAETLAGFGLRPPPGTLSGGAPVDLRLDLGGGGPGVLRAESELQGLGLAIPQLGWRMTEAASGRLLAEITLGPVPQATTLSLSAPGLTATGAATLTAAGGLDRLRIDRMVVGDWLDVTGALIGQGAGRPPAVEITGGRVSLAGLPQFPQGNGGPVPITARLDRVEASPTLALTGLEGLFEAGGGSGITGEFTAGVNGRAGLSGILGRNEFGPDLRLLSADGGAVLRAAGIFENAYGGRMTLRLRAREVPRTFRGVLAIDGPRLRDAPAMAELLSAISVVGLLEQLGGDGIALGEVDARFVIEPGRLVLNEGTAVGPSLGISMDGVYDLSSRRFDMQGVVSPLYIVNGLVGALFAPRREGLFGFAYRLTGSAEDSSVTVNPLSILTPGIFREIFRRPPPELTEPETQTQ